MSVKRKFTLADEKRFVIDTEQYQRERDGDEDPQEVEEKQWLNKEQMTCYQIRSLPASKNDATFFPNFNQRLILFDWLREVAQEWNHHVMTWYMACNYVDRYVILSHPNKQVVCRQNYQLLGVTCLWIAGKMEEIWSPPIDTVVNVADNCITIQQVKQMEYSIIEVLHADFRPPTVYGWIEHIKPNWLMNNIKLQFVLVCIQLEPLFATLLPSQLAHTLLKDDTTHFLYSRLHHYKSIYEKHKEKIDFDSKLQIIKHFSQWDAWQEWLKVETTAQ